MPVYVSHMACVSTISRWVISPPLILMWAHALLSICYKQVQVELCAGPGRGRPNYIASDRYMGTLPAPSPYLQGRPGRPFTTQMVFAAAVVGEPAALLSLSGRRQAEGPTGRRPPSRSSRPPAFLWSLALFFLPLSSPDGTCTDRRRDDPDLTSFWRALRVLASAALAGAGALIWSTALDWQ